MTNHKVKITNSIHICDQVSKVKYEQYGWIWRILIVLAGLAMIASGFLISGSRLWQAILVVLGIWVVISYNYPFVIMSERMAAADNFLFPDLLYDFSEENFSVLKDGSDEPEVFTYSRIDRMLRDAFGLYIFLDNRRGYLLMQDAFSSVDRLDDLCNQLEQVTGKTIRSRNATGISRLVLRLRDSVESVLSSVPALLPFVKRVQENRAEKQQLFELEMKEKEEAEAAATIQQAKSMQLEQEFFETLRDNPEKMEEFRRSVQKGDSSRKRRS